MILMSVASPMPAKSDNGSISFEHSDNKRGLSAKTLGKVDVIDHIEVGAR